MMKRISLLLALLLAIAVALPATAEMTAKDIIAKSDDLMRGESSYSELTMKVTSPFYKREMKLKAWTRGRDESFIVVTSPAKDRGVAFLKLDRTMWNYLPTVERTLKMPPSVMAQSWMGSDFSNNDLSRADTMIVDFEHKLVGEETFDGAACWKIELITKPDAPVVWSKIVGWIDKQNYVMRKAEYYDDDGAVAREMTVRDIKTVGTRQVGTHWLMINKKKKGQQTEMFFENMQFDLKIPDSTFSKRNLTSGVR
jgi:outer membrane lipoprotein-sorting protein